MIAFVQKTDLDQYKYIADSVKNSTSWPQFVSEAQLLDVKVWLGDSLLNEIASELATPPASVLNQSLLNGGTYVYQTKTYMFQGLKAAIIYYAFARMTKWTAFNYTAAGIVIKDSDLSTPISDKQMQMLATNAQLTAEAIKCEIISYLNRNHDDYPLWDHECGCGSSCRDGRPFQVWGD